MACSNISDSYFEEPHSWSFESFAMREVDPRRKQIDVFIAEISEKLIVHIDKDFINLARIHERKGRNVIIEITKEGMDSVVEKAITEVQKKTTIETEDPAFLKSAEIARQIYAKRQAVAFSRSYALSSTKEETIEAWLQRITITATLSVSHFFVQKVIPITDENISSLFSRAVSFCKKQGGKADTNLFQGLSCFDYALCRSGETEVLWTEFTEWEFPFLLEKWGYEFHTGDPKPGDLVLFLNGNTPTHLGIYRKEGLIESKWGNFRDEAYLHRLEDAPEIYGKQMVYCRKKPL